MMSIFQWPYCGHLMDEAEDGEDYQGSFFSVQFLHMYARVKCISVCTKSSVAELLGSSWVHPVIEELDLNKKHCIMFPLQRVVTEELGPNKKDCASRVYLSSESSECIPLTESGDVQWWPLSPWPCDPLPKWCYQRFPHQGVVSHLQEIMFKTDTFSTLQLGRTALAAAGNLPSKAVTM